MLSQLDATLSHRDSYIAGREQRIESLKNILRKSDFSDAQRYILNQQLIDEYTPYQADSTIDYLYRNIALATRMNDAGHLNESRIQLAYGFFSKFFVFAAAFSGGFHLLVFIALVNTVVSLYYYLLIVKAMYITPGDAPIAAFRSDRYTRVSLALCMAGVLLLGIVSAVYDGINAFAFGL